MHSEAQPNAASRAWESPNLSPPEAWSSLDVASAYLHLCTVVGNCPASRRIIGVALRTPSKCIQ
jgi:hypothetical protein